MSDRSSEHRSPDTSRDEAAGAAAESQAPATPTKRDKVRMVAVQTGAYAMMVPWG